MSRRNRVQPLLLAFALVLAPLAGLAQGAKLRMPDFPTLAAKATESMEISLDAEDIRNVGALTLGGRNAAGDPAMVELLKGLRGIHVMMFEFERPGQYTTRDIDGVVRQAERGGWKRLMYRRGQEDRMEMWMREDGSEGGLLVVVGEPKELVLIHIAGKVDLQTLSQLQGRLGVPHVPGVGRSATPPASSAPPGR